MNITIYTKPRTTDWYNHAACRGQPPTYWHPPPAEKDPYAYTIGRIICTICPVSTSCLSTALVNNETRGMWGGTTPRQRQRIAKTAHISYPCQQCNTLITHPANDRRRNRCAPCRQIRRQHQQRQSAAHRSSC